MDRQQDNRISNRTPLLDRVTVPADLRELPEEDLRQLADELRAELIDAVSVTGGHLGAGLGVVELTVALHYVFQTPTDRLIWDVGHQAYPHKILTGRRDRIRTLRMGGGLSGFTRRAESEYDPFGAAHSSTSISSALGMAVARDLKGDDDRNVIAVIGDGAMSAGMAYEAMNNAGSVKSRLIVILNDNDMSIAPPVGAMSAYLSRLLSSKSFLSLRQIAKEMAKHFPKQLVAAAGRADEYARGFVTGGGTLFEELGFYYIGPIDGHNLDHLLPVLKNVRDSEDTGPVLIHVVTKKGHGYPPAEKSADKYHGVVKFDVVTGVQSKAKSVAPAYQNVFAKALIEEARHDDRIVAITAAMPSGTGLNLFGQAFPERCFDVGIAEQHGVTRMPARSISPISAACPASSSWRRPTRPSSCTWWRRKRRSTIAPPPCATRAATAPAWRCRSAAMSSISAADGSSKKARRWRFSASARGSRNASRRRRNSRHMAFPSPSPMRASPSRSTVR